MSRVESLRPDMPRALSGGGRIRSYVEDTEGTAPVILTTTDGAPVARRSGRVTYMAGWGDAVALDRLVAGLAMRAGVAIEPMPDSVRVRDTGTERFWFNHGPDPVETPVGVLPPAGIVRVPST